MPWCLVYLVYVVQAVHFADVAVGRVGPQTVHQACEHHSMPISRSEAEVWDAQICKVRPSSFIAILKCSQGLYVVSPCFTASGWAILGR